MDNGIIADKQLLDQLYQSILKCMVNDKRNRVR